MNTINHEIFKHGMIAVYCDSYGNYAVTIYYHRFVKNKPFMYSRCMTFNGFNAFVKAELCYIEMREYLGTLLETVK